MLELKTFISCKLVNAMLHQYMHLLVDTRKLTENQLISSPKLYVDDQLVTRQFVFSHFVAVRWFASLLINKR